MRSRSGRTQALPIGWTSSHDRNGGYENRLPSARHNGLRHALQSGTDAFLSNRQLRTLFSSQRRSALIRRLSDALAASRAAPRPRPPSISTSSTTLRPHSTSLTLYPSSP